MNLRQKSLEKLEVVKVLSMLERNCTSRMGAELARNLQPLDDLEKVSRLQQQTTEGREVLRLYPTFPLGGIRDLRLHLERAAKGGVLEPDQLLEVLDTLVASRRIKTFAAGMTGEFPTVKALGEGLEINVELERILKTSIAEDGSISDNASPKLASLRRELAEIKQRVRAKLDNMIRSAEIQKYLQDNIVSLRNDRYVLPVKQEYRGQIPGLVHDQSASGATLFIEPMAVVELNNNLRAKTSAREQEERRVLNQLTQKVAEVASGLYVNLELLAQADFILAKAKLSIEMAAWEPLFNDQGRVNLIKGRHPLLRGNIVPISVTLGTDFSLLVVTGPNTGGKTVALKTIGLLTLMGQMGLHIPAEEQTELAVFRDVFVDIGDEQSIEQSLSTFSSHMRNLIAILQHCSGNSLVLLDELGAGTDPSEGAALARSILEHLRQVGARVVATTHYSELKGYAYSQENVENASVEFDLETLQPTYRLLVGLPGRSNAFEIASRLGLPAEIVERAKGYLSGEEIEVSDLIQSLTQEKQLAEEEYSRVMGLRQEVDRTKKELEEQKRSLAEKQAETMERAYEQAGDIVRRAEEETREMARRFRNEMQSAAGRERTRLEQELKDKLKEKKSHLACGAEQHSRKSKTDLTGVLVGQTVYIPRLNQKGTVLELPQDGEVVVQAGIMKIKVPLQDLQPAEEQRSSKHLPGAAGSGFLGMQKAKQISTELDLRGKRAVEALEEVEKYLDDAYLAGLSRVTIIHGKGTGALAKAIRDYLKENGLVASYRWGETGEGGLGVTIVELS